MATHGIKISKTGYDAKTTGDGNLLLSSEFNYLKVGELASGDLTLSSSSGTKTITHGMTYHSARFCYMRQTTDTWYQAETLGDALPPPTFRTKMNTNDIIASVNGTSGQTYRIKCLLCRNPINNTSYGADTTGTYGVKVSLDGQDVNTARPEFLAMSSDLELMKIKATGTGTLSTAYGGSTDTDIITHNLGYYPAFMVWVSDDKGYESQAPRRMNFLTSEASGTLSHEMDYKAKISTTQLSISLVTATHADMGTVTANYRYFIFANKLE